MQRFAVVSDIHGNLPALEAVLADMADRRVEGVINLGDNLSGPLWPAETARVLMQQDWLNVQGNHDWNLLYKDPTTLSLSDADAYRILDDEIRAWLKALPASLTLPGGILAFHGIPAVEKRLPARKHRKPAYAPGHPCRDRCPPGQDQRQPGAVRTFTLSAHGAAAKHAARLPRQRGLPGLYR